MNILDAELSYIINNLSTYLKILNPIMIFLSRYLVFIVMFFYLYKWIFSKDICIKKILLSSFIIFVISEIIGKIFGLFIYHLPPYIQVPGVSKLIPKNTNNSFPSDHTIFIFSTLPVLAKYLNIKKVSKIFLLILSSLVAFSRIWVGVHYPSDVLFSILICFIIVSLIGNKLISSKIVDYLVNCYMKIKRLITNRN